MPEKKRIRKIWTGKDPSESIDEAIELLKTIKNDLISEDKDHFHHSEDEGHFHYYELIGIKIVYDVEE